MVREGEKWDIGTENFIMTDLGDKPQRQKPNRQGNTFISDGITLWKRGNTEV